MDIQMANDQISAELCDSESESQVSPLNVNFDTEFPDTTILHSASKCATPDDLNSRYLHLENSVNENVRELPFRTTGNQSDKCEIDSSADFSSGDWYDRNIETECNGGLWKIDNIEVQLEKFVSEEMTDVGIDPSQNSDRFEDGNSIAFKVTEPEPVEMEPNAADECCQTASSADGNILPICIDKMNCDDLHENILESRTNVCTSECLLAQTSFHDQNSELYQAQSVEDNREKSSDSLNGNTNAQFVTPESLEHLQTEMIPGDDNAGSDSVIDLPTKQWLSIDHGCYMSDTIVEPSSKVGLDPMFACDTVDVTGGNMTLDLDHSNYVDLPPKERQDRDDLFPPFALTNDTTVTRRCSENSMDMDPFRESSVFTAQSHHENFPNEQLLSAADVNIEALLHHVDETRDNTLPRNSFATNDQTPFFQNNAMSDSNDCNISSNQTEICEDLSPFATIADPFIVGPKFLLKSAEYGANEGSSSVSSSEDFTKQLDKKSFLKNEAMKVVDLAADSQVSDFVIADVVKSIKKEEPWSFDSKTSADDVWIEPIPHGLKMCYCPHGYVSSTAGHFHCQECGRSNRHKSSMIRHEVVVHRIRHQNVKILPCDRCSGVFIHASELKRHMLMHNGKLQGDKKDKRTASDFELQKSESGSLSSSAMDDGCDRQLRLVTPGKKTLKVAFQNRKRRKRMASEPSPTNLKKIQPDAVAKEKLDDRGISLQKEFSVSTLTAGQMTTCLRPAYDGPLLPVLLRPTKYCKFCGQHFVKEFIQHRHYAQVHRLYLGGISLYRCTTCKFRTICHADFESHISTERHRVATSIENERNLSSGEAALTDDDALHQNIILHRTKKKKRRPSGLKRIVKKPFKPSDSRRSPRSASRNVSHSSCSKNELKLKSEVSKYSRKQKINKFFSLLKSNDNIGNPSNFKTIPLSGFALNACVSGHVCTIDCICNSDLQEVITSDVGKQNRDRSKVSDRRSTGNVEITTRSEFSPVILESYSCVPSTWSNTPREKKLVHSLSTQKSADTVKLNKTKLKSASTSFYGKGMQWTEDDDRVCSRSISTTANAIKFYQDTKNSFFTSSVAQNVKSTSADEDDIPTSKSRMPVALKRSPPNKKKDLTVSKDPVRPVVIQVSDDDESSNLSALTTDGSTVSKCRVEAKQVVSSSSHDLLNPASVNSSVSGNACGLDDIIELDDDDSDDGHVISENRSKSKENVKISRKQDLLDVAYFDKDASFSEFSNEMLFSELEKRNCVRLCHCGVYFLDSDIYNLHCAWHSDGEFLKCNFCSVENKDWYEFYSHILNHSK